MACDIIWKVINRICAKLALYMIYESLVTPGEITYCNNFGCYIMSNHLFNTKLLILFQILINIIYESNYKPFFCKAQISFIFSFPRYMS